MMSADEIRLENLQTGVATWQAAAPIAGDRPAPVAAVAWNGYVDSTQFFGDRIQGYTSQFSYDLGDSELTVQFMVESPGANFDVEVYRLGYYGGNGARLVAKLENNAQIERANVPDPVDTNGWLVDCNWTPNVFWKPEKINGRYHYRSPSDPVDQTTGQIPAYPLLSGVYYVKLKRDEPGGGPEKASGVMFVLTDNAAQSDVVMQTADTTWQAYNTWGNKSLYYDKVVPPAPGHSAPPEHTRAFKVSYNRPFDQVPYFLTEERLMLIHLEQYGYDVTYKTHADVDRYYNEKGDAAGPGSLRQSKAYVVGGHDEYWSGEHMKALEMARINDVSLMFHTGNEAFWKTRWEDDYRTLVSYKETQNNGFQGFGIDPSNEFTGLWRDFRNVATFNAEYEVQQPENALTGTLFTMNNSGVNTDPQHATTIAIPAASSTNRLWRNTTFVDAQGNGIGGRLNIPLGPEWDYDLDNGSRPAGLVQISQTTVTSAAETVLQDFGSVAPFTDLGIKPDGTRKTLPVYLPGQSTHNMTMYRSSRKGLVFSTGTGTWSWGLAASFTQPTLIPPQQFAQPRDVRDNNVIQATFNVLADMGALPHALAPISLPLVFPSGITDTMSPISYASTAQYVAGAGWSITGQSVDTDNNNVRTNTVANVEVSGDGGATWHRATFASLEADGTTWNWFLTLPLPATQVPFILTRATDRSLNLEQVRAFRDAASNTLYVNGGSVAASGPWDSNIEIERARNTTTNLIEMTVTNRDTVLPVYNATFAFANNVYTYDYSTMLTPNQTAAIQNLVVNLAIGANNVTITDSEKTGMDSTTIAGSGVVPTIPGNVTIRGGIGKDTFTADRVKIGANGLGDLVFDGGTGADTVNVTNSVVVRNTFIDGRHNGNGSNGTVPVGASITFDQNTYPVTGSTLTIRTGVANDQVTARNNGTSGGGRLVNTFSGNDTITRGAVNIAVDKVIELMGGDGDDTYAYSRTNVGPDSITDSGGSDWLDLSAAPAPGLGNNFTIPPQFENIRGSAYGETINGDSRDNVIEGNGGNDILVGGAGNDTYRYSGHQSNWGVDTVTELLDQGTDTFDFSAATGGSAPNGGVLATLPSHIENARSSRLADSITGNELNNTLSTTGSTSMPENPGEFNGKGGANTLIVDNGNIYINAFVATGAVLNTVVSNGAHFQTDRLNQNGLTIGVGSRVTLTPDENLTNLASVLNLLFIGAGATLDITDHAMVVNYSTESPVGNIRSLITLGRGTTGFGSTWTGYGITSSTAAAANAVEPESRSVGYAENSELPLGPYSNFRGVAVDDTCVLIAYTKTGDTNLDGVVDDQDVTVVSATYDPNTAQPSWALGDFDFNGFVDDADMTLIGAFYDPNAQPV
jgi:hypothetical protein